MWAPESSLLLFGNEVLKIIHYKLVQQVAYCPICLFVGSPKRFIVSLAEKHAQQPLKNGKIS
jgi:hypothetical protein